MHNAIKRKIYIGGVKEQDDIKYLSKRLFSEFGIEVLKVQPIFSKDGFFRNFAYLNILCTDDQMHKMVSLYNMKIWKGGKKLRIEPAKIDFMARLSMTNQQKIKETTTTKTQFNQQKNSLGLSIKKCLRIRKPNGKFLYIPSKTNNTLKFTKLFNEEDNNTKLKYYYTLDDFISYKNEDEYSPKINFSFLFLSLKSLPVAVAAL